MTVGVGKNMSLKISRLGMFFQAFASNEGANVFEISEYLKRNEAMTRSYRSWLIHLKLLTEKNYLTELGKLVLSYDPELQQVRSIPLVYSLIVSNPVAVVFYTLINNIFYPNSFRGVYNINKKEIKESLQRAGIGISSTDKQVKKDLNLSLNALTDDECFQPLNLCRPIGKNTYRIFPHIPSPKLATLILFIFRQSNSSPSKKEIFQPGNFSRIFLLSNSQTNDLLAKMQQKNLIRIREYANVSEVVLKINSLEEILRRFYET